MEPESYLKIFINKAIKNLKEIERTLINRIRKESVNITTDTKTLQRLIAITLNIFMP